jgi:hypothetical protein
VGKFSTAVLLHMVILLRCFYVWIAHPGNRAAVICVSCTLYYYFVLCLVPSADAARDLYQKQGDKVGNHNGQDDLATCSVLAS